MTSIKTFSDRLLFQQPRGRHHRQRSQTDRRRKQLQNHPLALPLTGPGFSEPALMLAARSSAFAAVLATKPAANYLWIGMFMRCCAGAKNVDAEALQKLVRDHWHRWHPCCRALPRRDWRRFQSVCRCSGAQGQSAGTRRYHAAGPSTEGQSVAWKPKSRRSSTDYVLLQHLRTGVNAEIEKQATH